MYATRCSLVRSNLDGISGQRLWEILKVAEAKINKNSIMFEEPEWAEHALAAIKDYKSFKFVFGADGTENRFDCRRVGDIIHEMIMKSLYTLRTTLLKYY